MDPFSHFPLTAEIFRGTFVNVICGPCWTIIPIEPNEALTVTTCTGPLNVARTTRTLQGLPGPTKHR